MPTKHVHFKINFDDKGNIVDVEDPRGQKCPQKMLNDDPLHNVKGMATLIITGDDDPCIVQGGRRWCW